MDRDIKYEKNNIAFDEQYPEEFGGGIKCKNYKICGEILPKWWYECKNNYLCTNCHMLFGTWGNDNHGKGELTFDCNLECPICLVSSECVTYPNCEHSVCIDCFKRCFYGSSQEEPIFPYPDIEEEYYKDPYDKKWDKYVLIKDWIKNCIKIDEQNSLKYENEENLRKCPLCRK